MIKLVKFIDLSTTDTLDNLTVCQECGSIVHRDMKEEHQKWHTTVWLLNPQHRILR